MKIKYNGKTPVTNIYGNWQPGEIKEISDNQLTGIKNVLLGFKFVEDEKTLTKSTKKKTVRKKTMRLEMDDKLERDNLDIYDE